MKKSSMSKRIICLLLAAVFVLAAGCGENAAPVETTGEQTSPATAAPETEPAVTEEGDIPEETEEPAVMIKISDKLELPQIKNPAELKSITLNLNSILKNGYGTKSLQTDAFASVFDKIILFKAGKGYGKAFVLGKEVEID